jgi:hypothetical protein
VRRANVVRGDTRLEFHCPEPNPCGCLGLSVRCAEAGRRRLRWQTDPVLGEWLSDQRAAHRHSRLSKLRTHLLEELGIFN